MKIKLFGGLRQKGGRAELEGSGDTLRGVLEDICAERPALRDAVFDDQALHPHVQVMINGINCELVGGLEAAVSDGDQIALFPPIAGG